MASVTSESASPEQLLVLVPFSEPKDITQRILAENPGLTLTWLGDDSIHPLTAWANDVEVPANAYEAATILFTLRMLPTREQAPHLRYVHIFAAGTEHVSKHPLYHDPNVIFTSSSGSHGPQIAEWVMMTILAQSHRLRQLWQFQDYHMWGRFQDHFAMKDLVGQRMGILGYGSIGRHVARVAKAFGMDILAYTATPKTTAESRRDRAYVEPGNGDPDGTIPSKWYSGFDRESVREFLRQDIDVLVIICPSTPQTRYLIGEEELSILAKGRHAFIANVARGDVIDQKALIRALKEETPDSWLRGVALDVTDPEPLPANSELWKLSNVTISPHVSGAAVGFPRRSLDTLRINIGRLKAGQELLNVVERGRGY